VKIPFLNLKPESERLKDMGLMKDIEEIIDSNRFLFGPKLDQLEDKLGHYFQANVAVVGSGTDAIVLSLMSLGINRGDRVGLPAFSAIPTATAIKMVGAEPVYFDVDADTGVVGDAVYKKIKDCYLNAFIPVHLFGKTVNIEVINLLKKCGIPVVEDCAQSFGSKIMTSNNQLIHTGLAGDIGAFSFYITKNLGTFGDGGLVVSKNKSLIEEIKELRFYGQKSKYVMGNLCGINSRLDEIQCSIVLKKLQYFPEQITLRKNLRQLYVSKFKNYGSTCYLKWDRGDAPHLFPIKITRRKDFIKTLKYYGIETAIHYPFTLPEVIDKNFRDFPNAQFFRDHIVSLPFHPYLSNEEVEYIVEKAVNLGAR